MTSVQVDINKVNKATDQILGQGSVIANLAAQSTSSLQECQQKTTQIQSQLDDLKKSADLQTQQYQQAIQQDNDYLQQITNQFKQMQVQYDQKISQIKTDQLELERLKQQVIQQQNIVSTTLQQKEVLLTQLNKDIADKSCDNYKKVCYILMIVFVMSAVSSLVYRYSMKQRKTSQNESQISLSSDTDQSDF